MGGGRTRVEDRIYPGVGFMAEARIGDAVERGQALGTLYCHGDARGAEAARIIGDSYEISDEPLSELPILIKEVITA